MKALVIACVVLFASAGYAQHTPAIDVAGGYSMVREKDVEQNFHGWQAAVAGNITPWFGIVGEVGGNYKTISVFGTDIDLSLHSFMGGPRFSLRRSPAITPFAQFLVGAVRLGGPFLSREDPVEFALQPGGGIDVWLARSAAIRVGGDYRRLYEKDADPNNAWRIHVGMVFGAGAR